VTAHAAHANARPRRRARKDWAPAFLKAFEAEHLVSEAAKIAGVGRRTVYDRRAKDSKFARAWAEVEERSTELLEREAYRRAAEGVERPVYSKGELVDHVREYSDQLLMFLLRSRRPDVYREHRRLEHVGPDGGPVEIDQLGLDLSKLSDRDLASLQRILGRAE
jgi:hypothetical protein